jgi:hypothetical protein
MANIDAQDSIELYDNIPLHEGLVAPDTEYTDAEIAEQDAEAADWFREQEPVEPDYDFDAEADARADEWERAYYGD